MVAAGIVLAAVIHHRGLAVGIILHIAVAVAAAAAAAWVSEHPPLAWHWHPLG